MLFPESRKRMQASCFALILMGACVILPGIAGAGTIGLETDSGSVLENDLVEVRIYGSNFIDGADGGDFSISWSTSFSFVDLTIENPPWDLSSFDAIGATTGAISFVDVFSFIDTPGNFGARFEIATLRLRAISAGAADVGVASALVGWSLGGSPLDVTYGPAVGITIHAIPEPATGLLLGLGLALLARRSSP